MNLSGSAGVRSALKTGDAVEWRSLTSDFVFRGVIEGFYGKGHVAFCTDQTGRPSRPVSVGRLQPSKGHWFSQGRAA